jgi:hypothetical protein
MSDYLTNLIVRSMGSAPVVKPRLPSLFEPPMPYAVSLAESYPAEDHAVSETAPQDVLDRPEVASAPSERPISIRKSQTERNVKSELPPPPLAQPFHAREPSGANVHPLSDDGPPARPFLEILQERDLPAPAQSPPLSPSFETLSNSNRPTRRAVFAGVPDAVPENFASPLYQSTQQQPSVMIEVRKSGESNSQLERTRLARQLREPVESQVRRLSGETEPPESERPVAFTQKATEATEPLKIPRLEFARHFPPVPSVSPPEPTIQVTIGRVEVRAASTQPATPKQRAPSPVMTLHDYLRSKRGGA